MNAHYRRVLAGLGVIIVIICITAGGLIATGLIMQHYILVALVVVGLCFLLGVFSAAVVIQLHHWEQEERVQRHLTATLTAVQPLTREPPLRHASMTSRQGIDRLQAR
jgi:hypothetical protein